MNRSARLPILLLLLTACKASPDSAARQAATGEAIDPATGVAADCGFVKSFAHPNGRALLNDFLARDGAGQLLGTDEWFNGATDCPAHEPGPDRYTLIFSYTPSQSDKGDDLIESVITSRRFGYAGADGAGRPTFQLDTGTVIDTIRLRRTEYGWRVVSPAPRGRVLYSDPGTAARLGPIADSVARLAGTVTPQ
jgi:hypothetical protein